MPSFKLGDRKVAVFAPQPFEDSSVLLLRSGLQTLELSRGEIADDHRGNATRTRSACADLGRALGRGIERACIGRHELVAADEARKHHGFAARLAEIMPSLPVP